MIPREEKAKDTTFNNEKYETERLEMIRVILIISPLSSLLHSCFQCHQAMLPPKRRGGAERCFITTVKMRLGMKYCILNYFFMLENDLKNQTKVRIRATFDSNKVLLMVILISYFQCLSTTSGSLLFFQGCNLVERVNIKTCEHVPRGKFDPSRGQ